MLDFGKDSEAELSEILDFLVSGNNIFFMKYDISRKELITNNLDLSIINYTNIRYKIASFLSYNI